VFPLSASSSGRKEPTLLAGEQGCLFSWGAEVCAALLESAGGGRRYLSPQGKAAIWLSLYHSVTINFMSIYSLS